MSNFRRLLIAGVSFAALLTVSAAPASARSRHTIRRPRVTRLAASNPQTDYAHGAYDAQVDKFRLPKYADLAGRSSAYDQGFEDHVKRYYANNAYSPFNNIRMMDGDLNFDDPRGDRDIDRFCNQLDTGVRYLQAYARGDQFFRMGWCYAAEEKGSHWRSAQFRRGFRDGVRFYLGDVSNRDLNRIYWHPTALRRYIHYQK